MDFSFFFLSIPLAVTEARQAKHSLKLFYISSRALRSRIPTDSLSLLPIKVYGKKKKSKFTCFHGKDIIFIINQKQHSISSIWRHLTERTGHKN